MTADLDSPGQQVSYSRITLIGRHKRADLVLPSNEPIGSLMPDVLAILDEQTTGDPQRLGVATAIGDLLPADATLFGAGVLDGAVLRLIAEDEIPPPPVVNDVTEETAADLERHRGRWAGQGRGPLSVAVAAGLAALTAIEIVARGPAHSAFVALVVVAAACWVISLGLTLTPQRWLSVAVAACGGASAIVCAAGSAQHEGWTLADRVGAGSAAIWISIALGAIAWRAKGPILGAGFGLVLAGGWILLRRSALTSDEADALVAAAAVIALGLLPRWAVSFAGLTSLDDQRMAGEVVSRRTLESSLVAAHSGLIWSTAAASAGLACTATALAQSGHPWPAGLAGATALVALLRARTLPLTAEVVSVVASAGAIVVGLELDWAGTEHRSIGPLLTTAIAAVLVIGSLLVHPPAHGLARLRRLADRVESLAVLALFPLVVGVFGVFGRLLHSF